MVYGRGANEFARESSSELEWSVVSVTAMFGDHGPAGKEHASIQIKRAAVERPRRVIWIADYHKLSRKYATEPLVYVDKKEWEQAARRDNAWLISSRHPQVDKKMPRTTITDIPQHKIDDMMLTEAGRYEVNRLRLAAFLGERFIEVDPPPGGHGGTALDDKGLR